MNDQKDGDHKTLHINNNKKTGGSQQRTIKLDSAVFLNLTVECGRCHEQPNDVCDAPGDLPLPLLKSMQGTTHCAPKHPITGNRDKLELMHCRKLKTARATKPTHIKTCTMRQAVCHQKEGHQTAPLTLVLISRRVAQVNHQSGTHQTQQRHWQQKAPHTTHL